MSKESSAVGGGISIFTLLAVAFVVLKLCKVIGWSWWWVLSPVWIPICIGIIFVFLMALINLVVNGRRRR